MKHILHYHIPKWLIVAWHITGWIWVILFYTGIASYIIYRFAFNIHEGVTPVEAVGGYTAARYERGVMRERVIRLKKIVFGK